jgi:hypothetical protein
MKAKKMDNLAEQAIKTDTVVGGSKGASQTPTPRPDPSIINNQIRQDRSLQEPLGAIDEPRSRIGSSSNTTAATKGTL